MTDRPSNPAPFTLTPDGTPKMRIFLEGAPLKQVHETLDQCRYLAWWIDRQAHMAVDGRRVRIKQDWRDQPYGRSKPNLKGKEFTIRGVLLDDGRVQLWLEGLDCAVPLECVELL